MPYFWIQNDTQKAILCALPPVSLALIGKLMVYKDNTLKGFLNDLRGPNWAPRCQYLYAALDAAALAPLGYASYLVWFRGGGLDYTDTKVALGLYAANYLVGLAMITSFKKQNLTQIAIHAGVVTATAAATAGAFWYIDNLAGGLAVPYAVWTGACAYLAYSFFANKPKRT